MMTENDLKRVDTRIKAKELFTIELDHAIIHLHL